MKKNVTLKTLILNYIKKLLKATILKLKFI
jgi:hypothetical protein